MFSLGLRLLAPVGVMILEDAAPRHDGTPLCLQLPRVGEVSAAGPPCLQGQEALSLSPCMYTLLYTRLSLGEGAVPLGRVAMLASK